jgi:quinoprotein glucose dehydrogenase
MQRLSSFTLLAIGLSSLGSAQSNHGWIDYGGGPEASKFVDLKQINKSNVSQLKVAWVYPTNDENAYLFNPIVVDNVVYVLARNNSLVAVDATSGKEIWIHENLRGIAPRGINYWESKDRKDRRLLFQMNNYLQAIDAQTGKSILTFGKNGLVNLREGFAQRPASTINRIQSGTPGKIFENLLVLGSAPGEGYLSAPGDIRAFDVITGKQVWSFHTIPHPGEFGYDTWPKDAWKYIGGTNAWGELSVDPKRGIVFVPTGSPTYDYYGADRIGSNLFANSLVALDARTGKRIWHYQLVHHDLWDYDLVAAPQLITVKQNGKTIDAVAQSTKHGFLFVFDRETGKPLFPIEERPVAKSTMPGEQAWPTQPFPTAPPPFSRQKVTADDINPWYLTAEERATWKDRVVSAGSGLFTPPSTKETIAMPGARGGSNWGTTAAYPEKGMVFLLTQDWPSFYKLTPEPPSWPSAPLRPGQPALSRGDLVYNQACAMCHGGDRNGSATVPALIGISARMKLEDFRQVVLAGKGKMPAFAHLDKAAIDSVYEALQVSVPAGGSSAVAAAKPAEPKSEVPRGPVVASGGAPGALEIATGGGMAAYAQFGIMGGPPYPAGVSAPKQRYYTGYGLDFPYVISPPWSSIVAYDLNTGTMKWKVPFGQDIDAAKEGAKNTGVFRGGERRGMIVTSTGLLFVAAPDGKVRAYDQENGRELWSADLPAASEGIPAMYSVNGRQYLVVSSSTALSGGRRVNSGGNPLPTSEPAKSITGLARGYIAFALPQETTTGR